MIEQVIFLAYVLMQFTNALVKPIVELVNLILTNGDWKAHLISMWPLYVSTTVGGAIGWYAHYNLLPMLDEPLGLILTAIGIGLGPSFIYDTFMDKPENTIVIEELGCSEDCSGECCK